MLKKPVHILEVGTAVGFSALLMSEYAPEECRITTIENYEKRIPIARENFRRAGKADRITLIEGDAAEVLTELTGEYDFYFYGCSERPVYPLFSGSDAAPGKGRLSCIR